MILDTWDDVRLLLELMRSPTQKAAAANLGMSRATLSRRLDALEAAINTPLFDRTNEGLLKTNASESLLQTAHQVESAVSAFERAAKSLALGDSDSVKVSGPPSLLELVVAPAIPELHANAPGVRLEIDVHHGYRSLVDRETDIAIRTKQHDHVDLVTTKIGTHRFAVVGAANHYGDGRKHRLSDLRWVQWSESYPLPIEGTWIKETVPEENIVANLSTLTAQLEVVKRSSTVTVVPEGFIRAVAGLAAVRFEADDLALTHELPTVSLYMACRRSLLRTQAGRTAWEFLQQRVRSF